MRFSCPACSSRIPHKVIDDEFICPKCGHRLQSNISSLKMKLIVAGVLGFPVVFLAAGWVLLLVGLDASNPMRLKGAIGFIYAGIIFLLYNLRLTIRLGTDEPSAGDSDANRSESG